MKEEKFFAIAIKVTDTGSQFKATGESTTGTLKTMIGEMELVKSLFIKQLEDIVQRSQK